MDLGCGSGDWEKWKDLKDKSKIKGELQNKNGTVWGGV